MKGTQAKGRNDMPLKATDCPEESPEELTWDTIPPFLIFPCIPRPCQRRCWQPRKETYLRKYWALERSQLELMRTAPQTCEPWDCRWVCCGHWPASTSRPP